MVKIEGGSRHDIVATLRKANGVPCVHLGFNPTIQSMCFGGYKVQGKTESQADKLMADCAAVVNAQAALLLVECVPAELAKKVQDFHPIVGIGAGVDCDGQVLVMHDMLGVYTRKPAKFVKILLA